MGLHKKYKQLLRGFEPTLEPITVLNDLSWRVGTDTPQMFVDGNVIPMSEHMIGILGRSIVHPLPLRLYFLNGNDYEVREYDMGRYLTGLEILGAIKTFWDEVVSLNPNQLRQLLQYQKGYEPLKEKIQRIMNGSGETLTRKELPLRHVYYKRLVPYQDGYVVVYTM